ncbi:hypothetical protein BD309DRAFT_492650 [Dichomitus squalens]|uniref:Uncharacterized protein n=1 Tax=Dichomitus squalens TaxID=114155 RepID=A0A4Q9NE99_9APHY|nr:hypothetical protein BD309DRAFT_492650 [Dichomitus squalens]TBU52882.1 hypothetical protein BD310DRAFT_981541 [Dichomitus squalens]
MSPTPTITTASLDDAPFYLDPAVGDLIIRSSDCVDLHVHKDIMTHASPVFSSMLSLPQPKSHSPGDDFCDKPLVDVHEDSAVWSHLIPICYIPCLPSPPLSASDLDLIRAVLDAARKYQMVSVTNVMRRVLVTRPVVLQKPVSVYAVGCVYGLEDVARVAAWSSLSEPLFVEYVPELDLISVRTFHRLSEYRTRCVAAALKVTAPAGRWENVNERLLRIGSGSGCFSQDGCQIVGRVGTSTLYRRCWATYVEKLERILEQTPDAAKARSAVLLEPVIQSAQYCHVCLKTIHANVDAASTGLEKMLKEAIKEVVLEF